MGNSDRMERQKIDESVRVEISRDRMLGVISFSPAENDGKEITLGEVKSKMREAGIISGINEELIASLMVDRQYDHKYLVARGRPPVHGEDGSLKLFFDTKKDEIAALRPKENKDGSVDFKKLDLIQTILKDQKLAQITLPTVGEPGEDVLGRTIKPNRGRKAKLPKGKNVYQSEDGLTLYASVEGQLIYDMNRINISETYIVEGNAGVATGDIDFLGNVLITGNVESGFTIKAGGNVEVQGFVEEATIIARNNILLRHGIQGKNKGKLIAGGDIVTKFIQNSIVETKGSLYTEAIMHSQVEAGDSIIVEVNKGLIVGGAVQATNLISAKTIGSPMSTATSIKISMALSLQHQYNEAQANLSTKRQQLDKVDKNIAFIHDKIAKGEKLPKARLERVKPMISLQGQLKREVKEIQKEYETLRAQLQDYKAGTIKVRDTLYPGCKITMGSLVKYIREDTKYVKIHIQDKDIKVDSYH